MGDNLIDKLKYIFETRYNDCQNEEPVLHQAVIRNDLEALKLFIKCKANVNIVDEHGRLAIAYVKEDSQLEVLDLLLAAGSNIYQLDKHGMMQFSTAFRSGHDFVIEKYFKYKINLNIPDSNGQTAIHYLMDNCCDYITYDLKKCLNFDVDVEDLSGQTPMLLAMKNENFDWVKLLLEKGANVNYLFEQSTPMYALIRDLCDDLNPDELEQKYNKFLISCLGLFVEKGVKINSIIYGSYTILKLAFKGFNWDIVRAILRKLALLETSGTSIIEIDRKIIEEDPWAKSYYSEMKTELKRMMDFKLYPKVSFFNILFEENVNTLAKYFQNLKFRKDFENNYNSFPNYSEILSDRYYYSMRRMDQISKKEEMLSEIFYLIFPTHIIRQIAVNCFSGFYIEPPLDYYES